VFLSLIVFFKNVLLRLECRGGRNRIGRREKSGRKCREDGENEILGVGRDG